MEACEFSINMIKRRLLCCGGERDASKRPLMRLTASKYSDVIILPSDKPRSEHPKKYWQK
jgi:UDP-N-acetylmuramoyl-L-alanyl-D-glutamate--2,6-diaminopimelate ligase